MSVCGFNFLNGERCIYSANNDQDLIIHQQTHAHKDFDQQICMKPRKEKRVINCDFVLSTGQICNFRTIHLSNFKRHKLTHLFKCDFISNGTFCKYTTSTESRLRNHKISIHKRCFLCFHCKSTKSFADIRSGKTIKICNECRELRKLENKIARFLDRLRGGVTL